MTVVKAKHTRKQRFDAALALAGLTLQAWASEAGVSRQHLFQVLTGERESRSLTERVDAFVAKHLPGVAA